MEVDWYTNEELENTTLFNDDSLIFKEFKKNVIIEELFTQSQSQLIFDSNIDDCFKMDIFNI